MKPSPTEKKKLRERLIAAWRLTTPYWASDEKRWAWGLLLAVALLDLGNVYISVRLNAWNNVFYDALQQLDGAAFFRQIGVFCLLAGASILMSVYAVYLNQMLQIRWRRWLTDRYLRSWLADRAYYKLQLNGGPTDNPDQRIAEDLNAFTSYVLSLSLGLLTSFVTLVSFLTILWRLSGPAAIPLGGWGTIYVPGYLVWAALLYAGAGTWLTMRIGRRLVPLNFSQQRFEADFRFSLMRLRENAESIALYGGERAELGVFRDRFEKVFVNFWAIMKRQKMLSWFTSGYSQIAVIFPVVVVAPRFFAKQIQLGGLMQAVSAFNSVQGALSFIINSYVDIANWLAVTERLTGFETRLLANAFAATAPQRIRIEHSGTGLAVDDLDLTRPDGTSVLQRVQFAVKPGEAVILRGPTGIGKSMLIRALAGIWPYGEGTIRLGQGRTLFLPQRPYLPLGSLADILHYPQAHKPDSDPKLRQVLKEVGLDELVDELATVDNWSQRLSLGEQQRLAFARVLLIRPSLLFLDEATSALDEARQAQCYELLRRADWRPTLVSVGHRRTLHEFHDRVCDISAFCCPERRPAILGARPESQRAPGSHGGRNEATILPTVP